MRARSFLPAITRLLLSVNIAWLTAACGSSEDPWQVSPFSRDRPVSSSMNITSSKQKERILLINSGLKGKGLHSSILISGIAYAESGLAHCWSEATWACKGPNSSSCKQSPVMAGASDGVCSLKQGGLGMFQFDSGTHGDTLKQYGNSVLTVEGNSAAVIPFLVRKITSFPSVAQRHGVSHVKTEADLAAWMNGIQPAAGNLRFANWLELVSCLYNGACDGSRVDEYADATAALLKAFGAQAFATGAGQGPAAFTVPEDCKSILVTRTSGDSIRLRSGPKAGHRVGAVAGGDRFPLLEIEDGDRVEDPAYPGRYSSQWVQVQVNPQGWISSFYAECTH